MAEPTDGPDRTDTRTGDRRGGSRPKRIVVAVGLTVFAAICSGLLLVPSLFLPVTVATVALTLGLAELGFGIAALTFVQATGRGVGYVGLAVPDRGRLVASVLGGGVALFTVRSVALLAALQLGGPLLPSRVTEVPIDPQALVLAMIPLSLFVVAPCEEALFRGVVQQYLGEVMSSAGAILGAGVLFAVLHLPSYLTYSTGWVVVMVTIVFVVGLGFGYSYERTGSIWVPVGLHGLYNALIMASGYLLLEFGVVTR
ncbi:CPBP family intramembrane glutamic endopeptidase [Halorientalis pallida]|uniref:CPBP family intramembrane metalloprotease n=1 Tax=Halorientalis pallida TaxID=2479928 RepID=A0A498L205_9EURY|nr:type II CAAX endopeptidase family protein [Halorientalis pallida]RXK50156.1 CPBP family intramembrane metalloprotease [Halorientalis pallida]